MVDSFWVPFSGQSMWPSLETGDQLEIVTSSVLRPGDIFLSRQNQQLVVHRAVWQQNLVGMKGDFARYFDEHFQLVGRVVGIKRGHRYIYWGERLAPFGKSMAWLSKQTARSRIYRWPALGLMCLLTFLSFKCCPSQKKS